MNRHTSLWKSRINPNKIPNTGENVTSEIHYLAKHKFKTITHALQVFHVHVHKLITFCAFSIQTYEWVTGGSAKKLTILFKKFKPNTVSSQLTFTEVINGSEHLPSMVTVIKHGMELLKISLLKRKHKPDASSRLEATGKSTDTRERLALLSIFNAKLSHMTRNVSSVKELLSLFSFRMWSLNVQLDANNARKS